MGILCGLQEFQNLQLSELTQQVSALAQTEDLSLISWGYKVKGKDSLDLASSLHTHSSTSTHVSAHTHTHVIIIKCFKINRSQIALDLVMKGKYFSEFSIR